MAQVVFAFYAAFHSCVDTLGLEKSLFIFGYLDVFDRQLIELVQVHHLKGVPLALLVASLREQSFLFLFHAGISLFVLRQERHKLVVSVSWHETS